MKTWRTILLGSLLSTSLLADTPPAKEPEPIGPIFEEVIPKLEETLDLIDRGDTLPKRTWLWGDDQRSNRREIDALLDEAIEALGVSGLAETREQIRELEQNVRDSRRSISDLKRNRVSAPTNDSLGTVARTMTTTREDYDKKIAAEEENIAAWETDRNRLRDEFAASLRAIGLELEDDAVGSLLSSVTGDDVVSMAIVFDHVRKVTDQLQLLTEDSGEDLETAKRYYGMYVVLVEVLNHIQESFLSTIHDEHVPALERFQQQAQRNIEDAQRLIQKKQGDESILRSNIAANETTQRAAGLYIDYVKEQARIVGVENEQIKKTLATARNTYATVKLSSDLATLMESGRRSFDSLMRLRMPYLREFRNDALRREFERMTEQLRTSE